MKKIKYVEFSIMQLQCD